MNRWLDVNPSAWYYNAVIEASNLLMPDGSRWIMGMTYSQFESGFPYVYHEIEAGEVQKSYVIPYVVSSSTDCPLMVFVDGVRVLSRQIQTGTPANSTTVDLYSAPKKGSIVSFISYGKPVLDAFGRPTGGGAGTYPSCTLNYWDYQYIPFYYKTQEYVVCFGKRLRRLSIPYYSGADINSLLQQYMGVSTDCYWISPAGMLYVPYTYNNVTCIVTHYSETQGMVTEKVKPTSSYVSFNNRYFPQAKMLRSEWYTLLNRLRQYLYARYTDLPAPLGVDQTIETYLAQNVFRLNGYFEEMGLSISVDGIPVYSGYTVLPNEHVVIFKDKFPAGKKVHFRWQKTQSRFSDVNSPDNIGKWWRPHVLELEDEHVNGQYIIDLSGNFSADAKITRAEAVASANVFRKWCIERFC